VVILQVIFQQCLVTLVFKIAGLVVQVLVGSDPKQPVYRAIPLKQVITRPNENKNNGSAAEPEIKLENTSK
jgi:hypothetical protein